MSHLDIHDSLDALLAATEGVLRTSSEIPRSLKCLAFFPCKHRLILVCVKIPTNDEPIYRRDFRSDEVADMRHQLIYGYFALSNVLCGLGFLVPMGN